MKTDIDGIVKALEKDDELVKKVVAAWRSRAEVKDVLAIFGDAGIEADIADVEEALRQLKAHKAEAISDDFKDLTEAERALVAGGIDLTWGSARAGDCDSNGWKRQCRATVEVGSWCWSNDYCEAFAVTYKPDCGSIAHSRN